MRSVAFAFVTLLLVQAQPANGASPPRDPPGEVPTSQNCVTRLALPPVDNVMESKWSPDSTKLLVVWFAQLPSKTSITGYREQEITDTFDVRT